MADLTVECADVRPERYAAEPTLLFRLRITEAGATPVHAIALRCQIRIEPGRRQYEAAESELLGDVFGDPGRWGETLRPMQFAHVDVMVPSFTGTTEIDVPVRCGYDLEVGTGKYFHALEGGEVPLLLLFSGTVFGKGARGFWVEQVPWHLEAPYRLPVSVWRALMDQHFPESAWLMLGRETVDAVLRYKSANALPTLDATVRKLLANAGGPS
ncbi:DUF6084 family protein [Amycolatopsis minnesotensis]|uniref:DUF6084 family protein n=1 Tax=Amycolatopsis minnesotensis TaxID=337894 RepID=A0ABP5C5D0_9PSEU